MTAQRLRPTWPCPLRPRTDAGSGEPDGTGQSIPRVSRGVRKDGHASTRPAELRRVPPDGPTGAEARRQQWPGSGAPQYLRAPVIGHTLWVTRHHDDEKWPCGAYPTQSEDDAGITSWIKDDEPLENTDVLLWNVFGIHHTPGLRAGPGDAGRHDLVLAQAVRLLRSQSCARSAADADDRPLLLISKRSRPERPQSKQLPPSQRIRRGQLTQGSKRTRA